MIAIVTMFSYPSMSSAAIFCGPGWCQTSNNCYPISEDDCLEECHFPDANNPQMCSEFNYLKLGDSAVRGKSIKCQGSTRLHYKHLDECSARCDSCVGCVGYVDNREVSNPYCVFKNSEATIYGKSSKDYYRGGYTMLQNAAISGLSTECAGSTKLFYTDVQSCSMECNRCDDCVGFVDNYNTNPPFCVFKSSEDGIYQRSGKNYHRKDTYFLKRLPMEALSIALRDEYDEHFSGDEEVVEYDDVVELSYDLMRGEQILNFEFQRQLSDPIDPCLLALTTVVFDAAGVVFQFLGISELQSRAASRALLAELSPEVIYGIEATVHDLSRAPTSFQKAKLTWSIFSQVKNAIGYKGIKKALSETLGTVDAIVMSVTIIAQLTAWFATDGAAVVAEMALAGAYLTQTVLDAIVAAQVC